MLVDQRVVRAPHERRAAGRRRHGHRCVLVDRFVHRGGDAAHQVRALLELRAVRNGVDADLAAVHESDAHPVAGEPGGEIGRERGAGGDEPVVGGGGGDHFEDGLELVARLADARHLLLAEHQFEAGRAPVQLAERSLQVRVRTGRDVEHDHAVQPPDGLDRVADEGARRRALLRRRVRRDHAAPLDERLLRRRREVVHVAPDVRPDRDRAVALSALQTQQHDPADDGRDQAALDREPALAVLARVVRARQHRPEGGVLAGGRRAGRGRPSRGRRSRKLRTSGENGPRGGEPPRDGGYCFSSP